MKISYLSYIHFNETDFIVEMALRREGDSAMLTRVLNIMDELEGKYAESSCFSSFEMDSSGSKPSVLINKKVRASCLIGILLDGTPILSFEIECIDSKEKFWIRLSSNENAERWKSLAAVQNFPPILHEIAYFIIYILDRISIISDRVSLLFSHMIVKDSFSRMGTNE